MAGEAVLGEAILENQQAAGAETLLQSVDALVAEHSLMAFRIAYSILRNHHDAEDAVQECFLRVLKAAKRMHRIRNPKPGWRALPGQRHWIDGPLAAGFLPAKSD